MSNFSRTGSLADPPLYFVAFEFLIFSVFTVGLTYIELNQRRRHIVISSHTRIAIAATGAALLNIAFFHLLLVATPTQPVWLVIVTFVAVFFMGVPLWQTLPVAHLVDAIARTAIDDTERPEGTLLRGDASAIRRSASKGLRFLVLIGLFVTLAPSLSK